MKDAEDLIPWKVTDISLRPYAGFWSMNPSIHFDGDLWRCVLRCCDYAMPDGVTVRSKTARSAGQQTKNAMVIFDPQTWRAVQIFKMHEKDNAPRQPCPHMGYEDMRIFRTDKGGLQGIAASLHLNRRDSDKRAFEVDIPQHQPPEQVLLSFDESYNIVDAQPIRGDGWSGSPQKNWVPFDHAAEPRFLYSISKGTMFDERGKLHGVAAQARPSMNVVPVSSTSALDSSLVAATDSGLDPIDAALNLKSSECARHSGETDATSEDKTTRKKKTARRTHLRGGDMRVVRGGRVKLDTISSRPTTLPARSASRPAAVQNANDSTRMMGSGRILMPTYEGLRGGSQLVRVADDAWLGIAHEMKFLNGRKFYWHTWYLVDSRGKMKAASAPMKLAPNGIEFAAGMAIAGDRVVVSFGVDDMQCRLGETRLSAVLELLRPMEQ